MAKFKKKTKTSQDIPTSALPDIIFMLLFFFMVTTVMRETELLINNSIPKAQQVEKLEKKTLISYIYIGKPKDVSKFGEEARIQLNDQLVTPDEIPLYVLEEKAQRDEVERDMITMSLKVDKEAKMGIVIDVKEKLRDANALKISYAATKPNK